MNTLLTPYPFGIFNTQLCAWARTDIDWGSADGSEHVIRFPSEQAAHNYIADLPQCFDPAVNIVATFPSFGPDTDPNEEPAIDDTVLCCPDCETPNQFGELCSRCWEDRRLEAME